MTDLRPDRMGSLATAVLGAATLAAALPAAYLMLLSFVGLPRRRPLPGEPGSTRFSILVPAHDEAVGIGATLESLSALDYPPDRYSVHVVADNCSDDTAEVVRRHGWDVHERFDPDHPGKGAALNWLFDRVSADGMGLDAVAVVDADTTVEPSFLTAMDRELTAGADAAQGFYSVRDPEASTATSFRFAALACRHHLRAQGRCRLGASCGLYGNGMAFRRELLAERRWSGHLVEDAEFQNDLLLAGVRVRYVPDAVVSAEMPSTTEAATTQNERWERGRVLLARRYVPLHLRRAVRGPNRIAHVDAMLDHLVPPISMLAGWQLGALLVSAIAARRRRSPTWIAVNAAGTAVLIGHTLAGLASVRAARSHYTALLGAPKIMVWKIGIMVKVLRRQADVEWVRTRRNEEAQA